MPNWAEGSLKIRGPIKNIKRFLDEGIRKKELNIFGKETEKNAVVFTDFSDETSIEYEYCFMSVSYIEHTMRAFVDPDIIRYTKYVNLSGESEKDIDTIVLPFKQAWSAKDEDFKKISKDYEIDIAIHTFENGEEFEQDILIIGGKIIRSATITYDDFKFESNMPMLGG